MDRIILICSIRPIIISFSLQPPLLIINTNDIDFVKIDDFEEIVEQIVRARNGTSYYQPMGSKDKH